MENEKLKKDVIAEQESLVPITPAIMKTLNIGSPAQIVEISKEVVKYVHSNELSVKIQDKPYVMVEGWQFTGALLGLVGMVEECTNQSSYEPVEFKWVVKDRNGTEYPKSWKSKSFKYMAKAVFRNNTTGQIVGQGFAMCTNDELKKHTFDEFAIMSMAQTRAIGKAARMAFSFIIKAAGYEPTPAEEMDGIDNQPTSEKSQLPEAILTKISEFEDETLLLEWAGSEDQSQYHANPLFRMTVQGRKAEIRNSRTNG